MSFEEDISYLLGDIAHYKELLADVSNVKVDTSVLKTSSTPVQSVTNSLSNLQITSTKDFDKPSVKSDLETIGKILSHDATKLTLIAPNSPPAAIPILRSTQTTLLKLFQTFFLLSPSQIGKTTHSQLQTLTSEILSAVKNHVEQFLPANSKLRKHDAKSGKKNNKNIESQTSSVGLLPNTGILWTLCADLKNFSLSNNICCKKVIDRLIEQINDAVNELQEEIDGIDNDFDEFDEEEEDGESTLVGLDRSEAELAALKNSMKLVKSVKLLFTKITKNMEAELFDIETGDSVVEMAKRCVEAVDDYVCDDAGERAPEKLFGVLEGLCDLIVSYGQREKKLGEKDEKWYELFKGQIVTLKNNMNSRTCKPQANTLYHRLKGDYRSVFWDEKEIHYTDEWNKTFVARLGKSNLFIPLISVSTLGTFGNSGAADNVLLEWDIAVDRFQKKELLILPLFILESGQKTFDFNSVPSHDKVCKGCNRSFKDIWDVFQGIKGFFINFDNDKDLRLLELEIMNLFKGVAVQVANPTNSTSISDSIHLPRHFVGRDDDFAKLCDFLSDINKRRTVLIHGGPGMGKTTIASKFASRSDLPGYTHVLWISMIDEQFIESISKTCTQLGLPAKSDTDKQQAVFNWLKTHTRNALREFQSLVDMLLSLHNAAIAEHVTLGMTDSDILHQEMMFWTRETVQDHVSSRLKHRFRSMSDDEMKSYNKILEYTEGYPLAIEQICGYLATQRSVTFSAFLDTLESGEVWKLNSTPGANHYQRTLHVVVENALSTLRNKNEEAYALMAAIANVSNKDIPIESYLARFLKNAGFTTNIRVALTPIVDMSLITFDPQDNFVSIHLAIQDEIRRILPTSSDTLAINYIELTVKSLSELLPTAVHESYKPNALNEWNSLFPLVIEVSKTSTQNTQLLADLCYNAADLASFFCIFGYARTLNESATEIYTQVNGSRINENVANAIHNLGRIAQNQGKYDDAKSLYTESVEIKEKVYGTREHASVAGTINNLGLIAQNQGKYDDAKSLYTESVEICEKVYGTREHASVAGTINNLGEIADIQGKYDEAKSLYTESVEIKEKVYGTREHASVATTINNLGSIAGSQGKYDEAKSLYTESVEIYEKVYGTREHASVANTITNLGLVALSQNKYNEAKQLVCEGIGIYERIFGSRNHPLFARNLRNLGNIELKLGNVQGAKEYYQESLTIFETVLGRDHSEYAASAKALRKCGK